jgi:hypothetical protein
MAAKSKLKYQSCQQGRYAVRLHATGDASRVVVAYLQREQKGLPGSMPQVPGRTFHLFAPEIRVAGLLRKKWRGLLR